MYVQNQQGTLEHLMVTEGGKIYAKLLASNDGNKIL